MRNYRYAVERAMRALGGWIALTPELSAKLLMGRHVWDLAQQADAFGRRLPGVGAGGQAPEAARGGGAGGSEAEGRGGQQRVAVRGRAREREHGAGATGGATQHADAGVAE